MIQERKANDCIAATGNFSAKRGHKPGNKLEGHQTSKIWWGNFPAHSSAQHSTLKCGFKSGKGSKG